MMFFVLTALFSESYQTEHDYIQKQSGERSICNVFCKRLKNTIFRQTKAQDSIANHLKIQELVGTSGFSTAKLPLLCYSKKLGRAGQLVHYW
jgi:hypothetical protein